MMTRTFEFFHLNLVLTARSESSHMESQPSHDYQINISNDLDCQSRFSVVDPNGDCDLVALTVSF